MNEIERANTTLQKIIEDTPSYRAFKKYERLVANLSLAEYAGLRMAVEMDRQRRIGEMDNEYFEFYRTSRSQAGSNERRCEAVDDTGRRCKRVRTHPAGQHIFRI